MTAEILNFRQSTYEQICNDWLNAHRTLKEAEAREEAIRKELLAQAGGERLQNGVRIAKVTREGGFDYKKACEDLLCAVILEPYKKLSTSYWKVTAY